MKSISVGELRQNPAAMVADIESGEVYELTKHQHRIGFIVPAVSSATITARRSDQPARTRELPRHELRSAVSIDALLTEERDDR